MPEGVFLLPTGDTSHFISNWTLPSVLWKLSWCERQWSQMSQNLQIHTILKINIKIYLNFPLVFLFFLSCHSWPFTLCNVHLFAIYPLPSLAPCQIFLLNSSSFTFSPFAFLGWKPFGLLHTSLWGSKAARPDSWTLNCDTAAWARLGSNWSFRHSPWPIKHSVGG